MHPACTCDLAGIAVVVGKRTRQNRGSKIGAPALRIKSAELVRIARSEVDFEIFLVIGNHTGLRTDKVVLNQTIGWSSIGHGINLWMSRQVCGDRAYYRDLVVYVRRKTVLRVVELNGSAGQVRI